MERKPAWRRLLDWPDLASGIAPKLPLLLAVVQVGGSFGAAQNQPGRHAIDALAVALLLLGPAALLFRKRWPAQVLVVALTVTLTYMLAGYPYGPIVFSAVVALVNAIWQRRRLLAWVGAFTVVGAHVTYANLFEIAGAPDSPTQGLIVGGWTLAILVATEAIKGRAERMLEASRAREAETAGRVTQERLRIAQELHDVVAHNISLINVQAGVALHLMDAQPEQARTALTAIKQASKEALVELRSVLGVLRQVDEPEPRHPAPGMARLPELVDRTRAAGLDIRFRTSGTEQALPQAIDIAVYRIAQEALTNIIRHAGARHVDVQVTYDDTAFSIEVDDDGHGADEQAIAAGGSGLTGMRERVAALGGELTVGQSSAGGFAVRARFPLER